MPLTAADYANIQRMIDATLDAEMLMGDLATMADLDDAKRDLENDLQNQIADVQHSINMLENSIDDGR